MISAPPIELNLKKQPIELPSNGRLLLIQVFRGLAAISIVIFHLSTSTNYYFNFFPYGGLFKAGWSGVDFFFVLSGFIISYVHMKDLGKPSTLINYFYKRATRIYPTYWVFVFIATIFIVIGPSVNTMSFSYVFKSWMLIPQETFPLLGVSWSLCYEIVFYLIFGLYILGGYRFFIAGTLFHTFLVVVNYLSNGMFNDLPILSVLCSTYNLNFLLGCFTALILLKGRPIVLNAYKYHLLSIGVFGFLCSWWLALTSSSFGSYQLSSRLTFGFSSLFLILGAANIKLNPNLKISKFFLKAGDASYVLYLGHPFILAMFFKLLVFLQNKHYILSVSSLFLHVALILLLIFTVYTSILYHHTIEKKTNLVFSQLGKKLRLT